MLRALKKYTFDNITRNFATPLFEAPRGAVSRCRTGNMRINAKTSHENESPFRKPRAGNLQLELEVPFHYLPNNKNYFLH